MDDFESIVNNCIEAYEKLNNDTLALDFCKISDKRLRTMVLNDENYKKETKAIYARQRLGEIEELEYLSKLAVTEDDDEDDDFIHPGDKQRNKGITSIDRDMLNIRFKAAQMRREYRSELASAAGDAERDTVNFLFIPVTREEQEKIISIEIHGGSEDVDLSVLTSKKEEMPTGTSELTKSSGSPELLGSPGSPDLSGSPESPEEPFFDVLENGEVIER